MLKNHPVHMLWVSGELSRLVRLSLACFGAHGDRVTLWSYDPPRLEGVEDGAAMLPSPFMHVYATFGRGVASIWKRPLRTLRWRRFGL
jgi:hypothetical protein